MLILIDQINVDQSMWVVLAGHIVITVPYTILVVLPRLRTLDDALPEAARDLGSSDVGPFFRITAPLILPAVVSAMIISLIISFDEYAIASFLVPPATRISRSSSTGAPRCPSSARSCWRSRHRDRDRCAW